MRKEVYPVSPEKTEKDHVVLAKRAVDTANVFNMRAAAEVSKFMGKGQSEWYPKLKAVQEILNNLPRDTENLPEKEAAELNRAKQIFSDYRKKLVEGIRESAGGVKVSEVVPWEMGSTDQKIDYSIVDKQSFLARFPDVAKSVMSKNAQEKVVPEGDDADRRKSRLIKDRETAATTFHVLDNLFGPHYVANMKGEAIENEVWHALRLKSGKAWSSEMELSDELGMHTSEELHKGYHKGPFPSIYDKENVGALKVEEIIAYHDGKPIKKEGFIWGEKEGGIITVWKTKGINMKPGIYPIDTLPPSVKEALENQGL